MELTSDLIRVADTNLAEQVVNEYLTTGELTLALYNDDQLYIKGDWVFAVEHESNAEHDYTNGEPIDNMHFLADVARTATESTLPFTITEVCQGLLDEHPGLTRYTVDRTTITMTTDYGKEKTWPVADYGIVTDETTLANLTKNKRLTDYEQPNSDE